jgi:hypothetical protein
MIDKIIHRFLVLITKLIRKIGSCKTSFDQVPYCHLLILHDHKYLFNINMNFLVKLAENYILTDFTVHVT